MTRKVTKADVQAAQPIADQLSDNTLALMVVDLMNKAFEAQGYKNAKVKPLKDYSQIEPIVAEKPPLLPMLPRGRARSQTTANVPRINVPLKGRLDV